MAKATIEDFETKGGNKKVVFWQETDEGVPEPALLLTQYSDGIIGIRQKDAELLINNHTLPELLKVLRTLV